MVKLYENIFVYGIIGWFLIIYLSSQYVDLKKYKLIYIAFLLPLINLIFNFFRNIKTNESELYSQPNYMNWLFNRIHDNSLYIGTGVFAIGLLIGFSF